MSALSKNEKSQIKNLVSALNSTENLGFKYPIGNKKLNDTVREFESIGYIYYDEKLNRWFTKKI